MKSFLEKNFLKIVFFCLIIKFILLFWSAHPFDFWAFVNTIQRSTLYDWNVFEYWNKGNLLISLWYPLYSFYLIALKIFSIQPDNLLFLHFIFKIPFLFLDLLCGFLIFKIVHELTNSQIKAKIAFLFWFLNPIIYYVYGIHGHYEIIIPLSLILIIFGLLKNSRWFYVSLGFIILISTKYFGIILLPFCLLYLLTNKKYKTIFKILLFLFIGLIVSYIQFFFVPSLLNQTVNSIFDLSKANAPLFIQEVKLSPLNIFSAIEYLFNRDSLPITNINNPFVFKLASYGLFISGLLLCVHFIVRSLYVLRKREYNFKVLIQDIFIILSYFLVLLTNFQPHYLCWIIPLFIIFVLVFDNILVYSVMVIYTLVGFIYSFRGELGTKTFFLDLFSASNLNSLSSKTNEIIFREGFIIILSLVISIFLISVIKNKLKINYKLVNIYLLVIGILWLLILLPFTQCIFYYYQEDVHNSKLAYNKELFHRGMLFGEYYPSQNQSGIIVFSEYEKANHKIPQIVVNIDPNFKKYFKAFILIKNKKNEEYLLNNSDKISFNNCLSNEIGEVYDYYDQKYYKGIKFNADCILLSNSVRFNNISLDSSDISLFIVNENVDYPFSQLKFNFILFQSIIGLIFLILILYFSYRIFHLLRLIG